MDDQATIATAMTFDPLRQSYMLNANLNLVGEKIFTKGMKQEFIEYCKNQIAEPDELASLQLDFFRGGLTNESLPELLDLIIGFPNKQELDFNFENNSLGDIAMKHLAAGFGDLTNLLVLNLNV